MTISRQLLPKYTAFAYGEGGSDIAFWQSLINTDKFRYHISRWAIRYSNASGSSPRVILENCKKEIFGITYDLVLCFIDIDKLKHDYSSGWEKEKLKLEKQYKDFEIIWHDTNLEDELNKVLNKTKTKKNINKSAKQKIDKFINTDLYKRVLDKFKEREAVV